MMSLGLGHFAHPIHKIQRLLEIGKSECARNMMLVDHLPLRHLLMQGFQFFSFEWRVTASAGNAGLAGKRCHKKSPPTL